MQCCSWVVNTHTHNLNQFDAVHPCFVVLHSGDKKMKRKKICPSGQDVGDRWRKLMDVGILLLGRRPLWLMESTWRTPRWPVNVSVPRCICFFNHAPFHKSEPNTCGSNCYLYSCCCMFKYPDISEVVILKNVRFSFLRHTKMNKWLIWGILLNHLQNIIMQEKCVLLVKDSIYFLS